MAANAAGKVVQITKDLLDNGNEEKTKTVLDTDAVVKIFGRKDVVNSPVAIYCIAGMLRKGKSFFLNLVMRYLKFKVRNKDEYWLDDKSVEINEGFEWRGGSVAHTKGIWIWSEPFCIETAQHGKVAVFLMDTQGIGDDSSSPETDANLFSLGTLLSSYHIYNMAGVLNRPTLDQLKTFTEFGKKLQTAKQELHQTLLFLMRDWQDSEYDFGFDGGSEYLQKSFTEVSGTSEHYQDLCNNIKTSFKEVKCALLPHPGKTFVGMKKKNTKKQNRKNQNLKNQDMKNQDMKNPNIKNQKYEDIDDDFLEEVEDLLNDMFSEICVKHNGEYPLTGNDIIDQATRFSHQMETPNGINAEALYSIVSQSFLANVVASCEEKFSKGARRLRTLYCSKSDLIKFHKDLVEEIMTYYDNEMKVTSENEEQNCRESLEKSLNERIFVLKNINDVSEQDIEEEYRKMINNILSIFKKALDIYFDPENRPKVIIYIGKKNLEDIINQQEKLALLSFNETTSQEMFSEEIYNCYLTKLKSELSLQRKLYESMNYILLCEVKKELLKAAIRANEVFMQNFTKGVKEHDDNDEKWFAVLEETSIDSYRSTNVSPELSEFEIEEKKMKKDISRRASICKQRCEIERAGRDEGSDVFNLISETKNRFSECINEDSMLDNSDEAQKYQRIKKSLLSEIPNDLKVDCSGIISRLCDNLKEENGFETQMAKDKFRLKLLTAKLEVATKLHEFLIAEKKPSFFQRLFSNDTDAVPEQLKKKKDEVMQYFDKVGQEAEGEERNLEEQVNDDLIEFFDLATTIAEEQVAVQKECDKEVAQKIRKVMIVRHAQQMEEMIKKTKVKKQKLMEIHDDFLYEYQSNVKRKFGNNQTAKEAISSFKMKIDAELKRWIEVNRFHKTIYPRELGRWAEITQRMKNKFESWWEGDAADKQVMKTSWSLPTKFGEI